MIVRIWLGFVILGELYLLYLFHSSLHPPLFENKLGHLCKSVEEVLPNLNGNVLFSDVIERPETRGNWL